MKKTLDFSDPYPGMPKILFIGNPASTHTQSWIDLLTDCHFNIRLFAPPPSYPPPDEWKTYTYLSGSKTSDGLDPRYRAWLTPTPSEQRQYIAEKKRAEKKFSARVSRLRKEIFHIPVTPIQNSLATPETWLAEIIQKWQPDIIHNLGIAHSQGGFFYFQVRKNFHLEKYGKWIIQIRGGSDLTLNRHIYSQSEIIAAMLTECNLIISDNLVNLRYAKEMGIKPEKFASITPVPGTGGIDICEIAAFRKGIPSQRDRTILYPKAYECPWSKALPVLEAIKIAWERITPCKLIFLATDQEIYQWVQALPDNIKQNITLYERIARNEALEHTGQSRLILLPSLVDGIPNSLYEAMALETAPIVSPLETLSQVVAEPDNVLFARNLYPDEIASALIKGMTNDLLVDRMAHNNLALVSKIANRETIRKNLLFLYQSLVDDMKEHRLSPL